MKSFKPINNLETPLLTDFYELTMAYGYWKNHKQAETAVFDLQFRKSPFKGEFAVFAGLQEVVSLLETFRFDQEQIAYLKTVMPDRDERFFQWLGSIDCREIKLYSLPEGTLAFPRVPMLTIVGPIAVAQLLESALLNLVNYPTLLTTNAARFRLAAEPGKKLIEFGLRRAQGPDGGISASRYAYLGGFDSTSNTEAGYLFDIPVAGTQAHSWIQSFVSLSEVADGTLPDRNGQPQRLTDLSLHYRQQLGFSQTNEDELASYIGYALAWPEHFLALVDTYDTLNSGIPNFLAVALALHALGYKPIGIRLDSGDLAYLSKQAREMFRAVSRQCGVDFESLTILASSEIDEDTLLSLRQQGHEVDAFGIGTHLVTCKAQPALGGVYKLTEVNGTPRIKVSQDLEKIVIPGRKESYRLLDAHDTPLADLMIRAGEEPPRSGQRVLCRHPFDESKRAYITPAKIIPLQICAWDGKPRPEAFRPLREARQYVSDQLAHMRPDYLRQLNPTPYKVSVSDELFQYLHRLWLQKTPVSEIR
jgi:nicotinate phosphoribosyltransferase